jgi:hypothetical protein
MKTMFVTVLSAGVLALSFGASAHPAAELDSNLAAVAVVAEAPAAGEELAGDPDPNVGPSTADEETRIGAPEGSVAAQVSEFGSASAG